MSVKKSFEAFPKRSRSRTALALAMLLALLYALLIHRAGRSHVADATNIHRLSDNEFARELAAWEKLYAQRRENAWHNDATGESWWMSENETSTGGAAWEMYERMDTGGFVNTNHIHPYQSELILAVQGHVRCFVDDRFHLDLNPGEFVVIPAGISHGLLNLHNDSTVMRVRYEPSLTDMSVFFCTLAELSHGGHLHFLGQPGVPGPLYASLIFERFPGLMIFSWMPDPLMTLFARVGAPVARLLGYSLPFDVCE